MCGRHVSVGGFFSLAFSLWNWHFTSLVFRNLHIVFPSSHYSHVYTLVTQSALHSLFPTHMPPDTRGGDLHSTECTLLVISCLNMIHLFFKSSVHFIEIFPFKLFKCISLSSACLKCSINPDLTCPVVIITLTCHWPLNSQWSESHMHHYSPVVWGSNTQLSHLKVFLSSKTNPVLLSTYTRRNK